MDLHEAMSTLRAVRRLKKDPIDDAVLVRVLEAATWAPSGGNRQPWRIIVVREETKRARLQKLYAPLWERFAEQYSDTIERMPNRSQPAERRSLAAADHLARHLHEAPVTLVFCFDPQEMALTDAGQQRPSIVGGASVYPAVENLLLACRAEGLGCTLTTLLCMVEPEVKELLGIPDDWGTAAHIPIGWPTGRGHGPISRRGIDNLVFTDTFGSPLTSSRS
jgi:nitroreductase